MARSFRSAVATACMCQLVLAVVLAMAMTGHAARLAPLPVGRRTMAAAASPAVRVTGPTVATPTLSALTAAGDQVRSFSWALAYSAEDSEIVEDSEVADIHYSLRVSRDHGSISAAKVSGTFSLFNPNAAPLALASVTAELTDRRSTFRCAVLGSPAALAPESHTQVHYVCDLGSTSPEGLSLVATMAWPEQDVQGVAVAAGADQASLHIAYEHMSETLVDDCVTVTDSWAGDLIHQLCESETFTFARPVHVPAGSCDTFSSTAIFQTNDFGRTAAGSAAVRMCVSAPLSVELDTAPVFAAVPAAANATAAEQVAVRGTVLVANRNAWQAVAAEVAVSLPHSGVVCTVEGAGSMTLAAGAYVRVAYACAFSAGAAVPASAVVDAVVSWDEAVAYTAEFEARDQAVAAVSSPAAKAFVEAPKVAGTVLPVAIVGSASGDVEVLSRAAVAIQLDAAAESDFAAASKAASI